MYKYTIYTVMMFNENNNMISLFLFLYLLLTTGFPVFIFRINLNSWKMLIYQELSYKLYKCLFSYRITISKIQFLTSFGLRIRSYEYVFDFDLLLITARLCYQIFYQNLYNSNTILAFPSSKVTNLIYKLVYLGLKRIL